MTLAQAQATVVASAQQKASNSSFYSAMRLMPKAEREAMFAIYGFCRIVDDIADEPGPTLEERHSALDAWGADMAALMIGAAPPRTAFLIEPVRRFRLKLDDFLAIIEGMRMDVDGPVLAPDYATLDLYCDRVASAVGRLSVRIFGMEDGPGMTLAHHLGRALQLTNILRDLDEDADMGRLYLPAEALDAAGIARTDPRSRDHDADREPADRAREPPQAATGQHDRQRVGIGIGRSTARRSGVELARAIDVAGRCREPIGAGREFGRLGLLGIRAPIAMQELLHRRGERQPRSRGLAGRS